MSLKTIIERQGRKQSWVAEQIGMPRTTLHSILNNGDKLPIDKIEPLARALGLSVEDIVREAAPPGDGP